MLVLIIHFDPPTSLLLQYVDITPDLMSSIDLAYSKTYDERAQDGDERCKHI